MLPVTLSSTDFQEKLKKESKRVYAKWYLQHMI